MAYHRTPLPWSGVTVITAFSPWHRLASPEISNVEGITDGITVTATASLSQPFSSELT